ncbi:MAG: glutamine synthetase III, partial [Mailhella sp.]|nr:glutamine synthetase III [Mailhella sp.]
PMTGITAEKHDSFISPTGDGRVIMEFSGKELVKGESDGSSFPNGGLRATFEARGYTAWDPTSCAFVKDGSLYIPTCFFSYTGESLDKKTPLLRSMDEVSREALRILRLFGDTETKRVIANVGAEQEYFLLPKDLYNQREDMRLTGRSLFGAQPPKGQELDDHYFGTIRTRVSSFMKDLDEQLWRLGILSKTKHNEGAPCQHELAPIYTDANTACDDNQLIMEIMKKCAAKHNLVCLLHEKPFAGVAGSGKHNNWSLSTDTGRNLFSPGKTPSQNARFLVFLAAFIAGVVLAGILASVMSTASGQLLAAASSVSENFLKGVLGIKMDDKATVRWARVTVLGISVLGFILALDPNSSIFRIVSFAWAGFGAAFGPVMLFALFWRRCNFQGALAGMVVGGGVVFIWKYMVRPMGGVWNMYELLPAFIAASIAIVVVSLMTEAPSKEIEDEFDSVNKAL